MLTQGAMRAWDALAAMRELPWCALDDLAPGTSLILAPHPDDESLGCGGLIAALAAQGRQPVVVCATDGAASHPGSAAYPPARLAALRRAEMLAACAALSVEPARVHYLDLPDAAAPMTGPEFDQAVATIVSLAKCHDARTIFATSPHDPHGDHEAVAAIARRAASLCGARLRYYPVWSWLLADDRVLPPPSGVRLDIAPHAAAKRRAIMAHASQYAGLITDSPDAFQLPASLLAVFDAPYEVFLDP
jgi:LmbE family N-acetylglucosaminyl deacetylase